MRVRYVTPFNSGASAVRQRTFMTRLERASSNVADSLAVGTLTGTKNVDHDRATIAMVGNIIVIT